ncbi:heavy-metal-associated domain-containing protein [Natronincola ferrireducens]|uniref:Heavy-metal-associated domain-containing protein n=1 Tax=Natronincola ferrireducens TaxID=393762 RepID=A0A1G9BAV0_9FIRM|nr:heavy-metal-associated domain-containing protein [Natronincola ferrireducens]SDK36638.1 Heavy-metal-associated domain-containing protein [Natronincola ferrireducens]
MGKEKYHFKSFNNTKVPPDNIKTILNALNGVNTVMLDMMDNTVLVDYDDTKTTSAEIRAKLDENKLV